MPSLETLDEDVHDIGGLEVREEASNWPRADDALALVADVHEDFARADFNDGSPDDFAWNKALGAVFQGFFHG